MGGPERIPDDFVEPDGAAVLDKGCFWREFLAHPGDVLESSAQVGPCDGSEGLAGLRTVDHQRNLVAAFAFLDLGAEIEVVVAVVHVKGRFHVVLGEVDAVGALTVDGVLEVAAALDFPAAVDVSAGSDEEGEAQENAYFFRESQIHAPKLEIIFVLDFL